MPELIELPALSEMLHVLRMFKFPHLLHMSKKMEAIARSTELGARSNLHTFLHMLDTLKFLEMFEVVKLLQVMAKMEMILIRARVIDMESAGRRGSLWIARIANENGPST